MDDAGFEVDFAALGERFRMKLGSYRDRLIEIRTALATGDNCTGRVRKIAHELAGSAGTFGFAEIGETAAALEEAADRVLAGAEEPMIVIAPLRQLIREVELSA